MPTTLSPARPTLRQPALDPSGGGRAKVIARPTPGPVDPRARRTEVPTRRARDAPHTPTTVVVAVAHVLPLVVVRVRVRTPGV